jgi:hypothetical protein
MRILYIPDTQVKPDSNTDHLRWAGEYAADKKPDIIIHAGDHWDMESLCVYDVGKKSFEGRQYSKDIQAGKDALDVFEAPIKAKQKRQRANKKKVWTPRKVFTMGNHENRVNKAIDSDRKLEGLISMDDFGLKDRGWEVHDFLEVVVIEGVAFSHYFTSGVMGRPVSSARLMLTKKMMSCVMGHVQDRDIAFAKRADGSRTTGIFAGIFYQEDQSYLTPQTNDSWKGVWMFNEVSGGSFDEMPISLPYLQKRYGS